MNARERIWAAAAFQPVDHPPFDFFEEAGDLFINGKYDPSRRLWLSYTEQVEAKARFHKKYQTDLIMDAPVIFPSRIPHYVRLFYNQKEIESPSTVISSCTGNAWNPMPAKLKGNGLLPDDTTGQVLKEITWENGVTSKETLDLASGTTDVSEVAFPTGIDAFLENIDIARADTEHPDCSLLRSLREQVGPDIVLSGTVCDPFSMIGWYLGIENLMFMPYDEEKKGRRLCEAMTEITIETGLAMIENGIDIIRFGAATTCLLSPDLFARWCVPYMREAIEAWAKKGVLTHLHMCGKVSHLLELIPETGTQIFETLTPPPLGDITMKEAIARIGKKVCLKGNLNPLGKLRDGTPEEALAEAKACVRDGFIDRTGFIFSVADCLAMGTPEENIAAVAEYLVSLEGKQQI